MPYESRICRACGGQFRFSAAPSNLVRGKGQFCSAACRGNPAHEKRCATCGEMFMVHACTERRGFGKYCSRACRPRFGSDNSNWRGGRINERGRTLVYAPDHPNATAMGGTHIYEYRLVASQALGRPLLPGEIVHHINGDHTDNRPDNLKVMTQSEHVKEHGWPMNKAQRS